MIKDFFEKSYQNILIDDDRKILLIKIAEKIAENSTNNDININFI